jgi:queuine tRNA-ribosyltransferase
MITTPHGTINTPVFMPVGTKATVKAVTTDQLIELNTEVILGNTYHLHLRPGEDIIKEMGGLHKWMNWNRPILTDSGGFQVFSLGSGKNYIGTEDAKAKTAVKITDDGVEFHSHLDGSVHYFTPEKVMEIEADIGADIVMAFDECAPATSDHAYAKQAMERTHNWALKCKKTHEKIQKEKSGNHRQALFPIIQGVTYDDLRIESAKFMADLDLPGIAIGGLSVGESKSQMYGTLDILHPHLPEEKPRYLMGVGTPEDILEAVDRGIDMFDCVLPTRLARHGTFWRSEGRFHIKHARYQRDPLPLDPNCICYACRHHTSSYIRHIFFEGEILAMTLLSIHNLHFLLNLMRQIQSSISAGTFLTLKKDFLQKFTIPGNIDT